MMTNWRLTFSSTQPLSIVEDYLLENAIQLSFISHTPDGSYEAFITGKNIDFLKKSSLFKNLLIEKMTLPEVCWEKQAELSPYFKNGKIEIKTQNHKHTFFLHPAQAFGDASHETTQLMLMLLARYVKNHYVLDIGTGSGILAIGAYLEGAIKSYGIDIDQEALKIAAANVHENTLQKQVWIGDKKNLHLSKNELDTLIILANMITSELFIVLDDYKEYFAKAKLAILSGILIREKDKVVKILNQMNWHVLEEKRSGQWLALVLIHNNLIESPMKK